MADATQTPLNPNSTVPSSDPQLGHLSQLHRMSRTAGAGSSEYSAVNIAAVVAVLIGAASALAIMTPVFLFLPVVGVIVAVLAIVQIRSSNGTQTGFALALLALVLSVGLSGVTGYQYFHKVAVERGDTRALSELIGRFGKLLSHKEYDAAYKLTDARFRDQTSLEAFRRVFEELNQSPATGPMTGIRSTELFGIDVDPDDSRVRMAIGYALVDTQKLNGDAAFRLEVRYRYFDDAWKIFAIPNLFAAKPAAPGNSGGAGSGGAAPAGPPAPR